MGHPIACAAALAVQQVIGDDGLLENVRQQGKQLETLLRETFSEHPHVGDIRGRGLFWGIELVKDKTTKQPFPPELKLHSRIKNLAMDAGLICYPGGGTKDGVSGDHIMLAPPFIVTREHLLEITAKLLIAINQGIHEIE